VSIEPALYVELSRWPGQALLLADVQRRGAIDLDPGRHVAIEREYRWLHKDDNVLSDKPHHPPGVNLPPGPMNRDDKLRLDVTDHLSGKTINFRPGSMYESRGGES
jgi:hypothetical protein